MKQFGIFLIVLSLVLFACCGVLAGTSMDKINNYAGYTGDGEETVNAYVQGDAYNYIINSVYFSGYAVYAAACGIGGIIALAFGGLLVCLHGKMDIIALQAARNALNIAQNHGGPVKKPTANP
mgnify:CR=1 FL=1